MGNFAMARAVPTSASHPQQCRSKVRISGAPEAERHKAAPVAVPGRGRGVATAVRPSAPFRNSR